MMKVRFFFAWYDCWVGCYYDRRARVLYVCPLPCCVFELRRQKKVTRVKFGISGRVVDAHGEIIGNQAVRVIDRFDLESVSIEGGRMPVEQPHNIERQVAQLMRRTYAVFFIISAIVVLAVLVLWWLVWPI